MLNTFRSSRSNILVWVLLGLLIFALMGFGLSGTVSGLAGQNVARVGDEAVETDTFLRAMQNEVSRIQRQTGQPIGMAQAQEFGIDTQVLSTLVGLAALDDRAAKLNLSLGDAAVREAVLAEPEFRGVDGFSQEQYSLVLRNQGLTPNEFERDLRKGLTREVLRQSVVSGTEVPQVVIDRLLDFSGETRVFSWVTLGPEQLTQAPDTPTEAEIRAVYDGDPDGFQSLEAREVTAALLTVEDYAATIEVSQEELEAEYEARRDLFEQPARRMLSRLVFATMEEAEAAKAQIEARDTSLIALAEARGLGEADISLGAVTAQELDSASREVVFGSDAVGIVGPVTSSLGPALFEVNAVIPERTVPLEDVADILRQSVAQILAEDEIADLIDGIDDLVAGGATLAELAEETPLRLQTLSITQAPGEGVLSDPALRAEVFAADVGEDRDLISLDDGGLAVIRVEGITPPERLPLDAVREEIAADLITQASVRALRALADDFLAELGDDKTFAQAATEAGYEIETSPSLRRSGQIPGLTPEAVEASFALSLRETSVQEVTGAVQIIHVDDITPFDADAPENAGLRAQVIQAFAQQRAQDLFGAYLLALQSSTPVTVNQQLISDLLQRYR